MSSYRPIFARNICPNRYRPTKPHHSTPPFRIFLATSARTRPKPAHFVHISRVYKGERVSHVFWEEQPCVETNASRLL